MNSNKRNDQTPPMYYTPRTYVVSKDGATNKIVPSSQEFSLNHGEVLKKKVKTRYNMKMEK
jgi:hypothetical protein